MAGKIEWIQFKGQEILFNDRSKLKPDDIAENVKQAVLFIKDSGKKDILYLVDNSGNILTPDVKDLIKASGKELSPYIKKSAVLGANGPQKILLNILAQVARMNIMVFDDIEKAKEWLVK
jgi:hypothetical protein